MKRLYKGSVPSGQRGSAAQSVDLLIFGDGTGPSQVKEVWNAGLKELGLYVKCGGVRTTDAEWVAAQPYLWRQPNGEPYTQGQFGWAYGDIQVFAGAWLDKVVVPHVQAALAQVPSGTYQWVMVDNCIYQHPSLFVPNVPPGYVVKTYHDATLFILEGLRKVLPTGMRIIANGWQGSAPIGFRGEALGSTSPNYADGLWFEGVGYKTNGSTQPPDRFIQDQGAFLSMLRAGKVCVWDEPGAPSDSAERRRSLSYFLGTTSVAVRPENAYFNEPSTRWLDWWRSV